MLRNHFEPIIRKIQFLQRAQTATHIIIELGYHVIAEIKPSQGVKLIAPVMKSRWNAGQLLIFQV
jgi:hypothetical protein